MYDERLEALKAFDTPAITNAVATYASRKDTCLGLYHPWKGRWYTDQTLRCFFPELGRLVGHVVTCVYGLPDPNYNRLGIADLLRAIDKAPKPVILVVKQDMPPEIKNINGLMGGMMMTSFKQAGVVGVISDGPSRDVDEVREIGIQYMLTGASAGHGDFSLWAINVPVSVCGMDTAPGEIIHMDESGAVKFPEPYFDDILENCKKIQADEAERQALMRQTNDVEQIIKIMTGQYK
jgi:4-hydroxy-4-methyl-2-oxoglutarate aldolase